MKQVSLEMILRSRDERAQKQIEIIKKFSCPVICFTMNIAGPVKTSPLIERTFFEGIRYIKESLSQENIVFEEISLEDTGCTSIMAVSCDAYKLKTICTHIEDTIPVGRLFDIDVTGTDGKKLTRTKERGCIVCGAPGRTCSAGRIHSVSEISWVTESIMTEYFYKKDCEYYSSLAVKSLIDEAETTPKPGLVDMRNNGSHRDMDLEMFKASALCLKPYFEDCFRIGKETSHNNAQITFERLKNAGIEAEQTMYRTTGGINTHKGAIYSMGILCGALGRLWSPVGKMSGTDVLCRECAIIAAVSCHKDLETSSLNTAGISLYRKYGISGIRGEAESGFESVLHYSLPRYKELIKTGFEKSHAGAIALMHLIANVDDTNLYHRGGKEGARFACDTARRLLENAPVPSPRQIEAIDDEFIKRNLSPGGCADLLAVTYFLYNIEQAIKTALHNILESSHALC